VDYKLKLSDNAKIHLLVQVSQLKQHISSNSVVSSDLDTVSVDPSASVMLIAIMDREYKNTGVATTMRVLVLWGSPSKLETWEDEVDLRRRYPEASSWGQAESRGVCHDQWA
jgi:hypothetical protein